MNTEAYRQALKRFDWLYEFSDCHQTYLNGRAALIDPE